METVSRRPEGAPWGEGGGAEWSLTMGPAHGAAPSPAELLGQATLPVGSPSRPLSRRQVCPLTPGPGAALGPAATVAVEVRSDPGKMGGGSRGWSLRPGLFVLPSLHSFSMRRVPPGTPPPPCHAPASHLPRRWSWTAPSCLMAPLSPQSPPSSPGLALWTASQVRRRSPEPSGGGGVGALSGRSVEGQGGSRKAPTPTTPVLHRIILIISVSLRLPFSPSFSLTGPSHVNPGPTHPAVGLLHVHLPKFPVFSPVQVCSPLFPQPHCLIFPPSALSQPVPCRALVAAQGPP